MALQASLRNIGLDAMVAAVTHAGLHTDAYPGGSTNEVTGGDPAYARQALTWGAAAAGEVEITNVPVFDIPAGTTVRRVGLWSAVSAGTFYGDANLTDESFAGQGTFTIAQPGGAAPGLTISLNNA